MHDNGLDIMNKIDTTFSIFNSQVKLEAPCSELIIIIMSITIIYYEILEPCRHSYFMVSPKAAHFFTKFIH